MTTNILEKTLQMVRESPLSVPQLASNADLEQRWLYMLVNGKIKDPGIRRLSRLHDYLLAEQAAESGEENAA